MNYRDMGINDLNMGTVERFLGLEEENLEDKPSLLRTVPGYEKKKPSRSKSKSKKSKSGPKSKTRRTHDGEEERNEGETRHIDQEKNEEIEQGSRLRTNVPEWNAAPQELEGVSDDESEPELQASTESSGAMMSYDMISVGSNSLDGYDEGDTCTDIFMKTFPFLGLKEAVVKMTAFTNPQKAKLIEHGCEPLPLPNFPGFICVGTIMSQTPSYIEFRQNDTVLVILPDETGDNFENFAKLPFSSMIKVPSYIDPCALLGLVLTYIPALQALQSTAVNIKHKRVLINGGPGPVTQALIRLCEIHEAKKIFVPIERKKRSLLEKYEVKFLGPSHQDWGPQMIKEVDLVIDSIGENNFATSRAALKRGGELVCIGNAAMDLSESVLKDFNKSLLDFRIKSNDRCHLYSFMDTWNADRESFKQDLDYVIELFKKGAVHPVAKRVTLQQYRKRTVKKMHYGIPICDACAN